MLSFMNRSLAVIALIACAAPAFGQLKAAPAGGTTVAEATETTVRFRVGAIVTAKRGPVKDILGMVAVPIDCDEQTVRLDEEDISKLVAGYEFRDLAGGAARLLVFSIPYLDSGAEARVVLTYKVTTRTTPPPEEAEADRLVIARRPPRNLRGYLGPSPFVESKHPKIKRLAKSIRADLEESAGEEELSDWARIEGLYDYVMDNIEYFEGPDTSALKTLADETADCHGRSALFVALCRASGVPARMVWVQDHCYPEFYVEDEEGEGRWWPAESAGTRAFGEMPIARTVMQKGDDFRVPREPGRPPERMRYATDFLTGRPAVKGAGKPSVKYLREIVP
ncbi:Transglutaminase-like superfamily protein [Planctomycetes bacterium MalM25]|nr:Transglutaminase-like superfamily protein [Planctomycetes bacterium MalM25]